MKPNILDLHDSLQRRKSWPEGKYITTAFYSDLIVDQDGHPWTSLEETEETDWEYTTLNSDGTWHNSDIKVQMVPSSGLLGVEVAHI